MSSTDSRTNDDHGIGEQRDLPADDSATSPGAELDINSSRVRFADPLEAARSAVFEHFRLGPRKTAFFFMF